MDDDNLIEIMAELRKQCEMLYRTPMDKRDPIRDRVLDPFRAYMSLMIPEPLLSETRMQAAADYDTRTANTLLDLLNDHE